MRQRRLTIKQKLVPIPPISPQVINSRAMFPVANPLTIQASPRNETPRRAVIRAPIMRIIVAFGTARSEIQAGLREPTKASVEGE